MQFSWDKSTHSQSLCGLARVKHSLGELDEARRLYQKSLDLEESPLAQYGLAQTLVAVVCCCHLL